MKRHPTAAVDLFGTYHTPAQGSVLAETWDYPPFSVLNARDGWWQDRKRAWLALGIESELGRGGATNPMSETIQRLKPSADPANYRRGAASCPPPTIATDSAATDGGAQYD